MILARRVGAVVLAIAAVTVWFAMAPDKPVQAEAQTQEQVRDRSTEILSALADYEANNRFTQGAPQQAVANGWIARDLLTIIAEQQNDALTRPDVPAPVSPAVPNDERIPALVGLLVVGLALALATAPRSSTTQEFASVELPSNKAPMDGPVAQPA